MTLWKLIKQTSKTFFWEKNNKPKNRTLGKNHIDRKHAEEKKLLKGTEKKMLHVEKNRNTWNSWKSKRDV